MLARCRPAAGNIITATIEKEIAEKNCTSLKYFFLHFRVYRTNKKVGTRHFCCGEFIYSQKVKREMTSF
jgi:hypothetical protein